MIERGARQRQWRLTAVDAWILSGCAAGMAYLVLTDVCGMRGAPAVLAAAMVAYMTHMLIYRRRADSSTEPDPRNPRGHSTARCLVGALAAVSSLIFSAVIALICAILNQPAPGVRARAARNAIVSEWRRGWAGAVDVDVLDEDVSAGQEVESV